MSDSLVMAVGQPPTFRNQVARALGADPDEVRWVPSVTVAEEIVDGTDGVLDAMVVSPAVKEPDALGLAEHVSRVAPITAVVVVRDRMPNGSLPMAMRAGVRDVVDLSKGNEELSDSLRRAVSWSRSARSMGSREGPPAPVGRGAIVTMFSSKGGVGKTFLAANLAVALSRRTGLDTGAVDLDLDMGDLFSYFGSTPQRPIQDLAGIVDHGCPETLRDFGTHLDERVWGYASPSDPTAAEMGGETAGKILRELRAAFPYVVIDATSDYSDANVAAFDLSDLIFVIAVLDVVSLRHLSKAIETLGSLGVSPDRLRVVLNRANSKVDLSTSEVERILRVQVDAMVPSSRLVPVSLNRGRPVVLRERRSDVARSIDQIAELVVEGTEQARATATAGSFSATSAGGRRGLFRRK